MEGLLPFLYRAILHYADSGRTPIGNPFHRNDSPSASPYYVRLAGGADSDRLRFSEAVPAFPSPANRDAQLL